MLVTLHLGRSFYRAEAFERVPGNVFFNCVSETQAAWFRDLDAATVRNGIDFMRFPFRAEKGDYLLWLGRICEEKGVHLAVEVARRTALPLVIAGRVYPFSYHQNYFRREVFPHLDRKSVRWEESPNLEVKLELLSRARALLVPTMVDETSSLVAMEAAACGTPVAAFRRGAMHEVVADRRTGFLVNDVEEMVQAVRAVGDIDPYECRRRIEEKYSVALMSHRYERLYQSILASVGPQAVTS
jgi:glycosyltransferase involved in cell wall biosynthesis